MTCQFLLKKNSFEHNKIENRPNDAAVKDIAIGVDAQKVDCRAGRIGHCRDELAATAKFLCSSSPKPRRWAPPLVTRCKIMKIL